MLLALLRICPSLFHFNIEMNLMRRARSKYLKRQVILAVGATVA
jgi:hypothetical protein